MFVGSMPAGKLEALNEAERQVKEDAPRWAWLQKEFANKPWKLVNMIPSSFKLGETDIRKAIDSRIEWDKDEASREKIYEELSKSPECRCKFDAEGFCPKHGLKTD